MITGLALDNTGAPGVTFPVTTQCLRWRTQKMTLHPAQHRTAGVTLPVCYWFLSEGWKRSALGNSQMKSLDSACGSEHRILLKQERRAPGWSRTCHPTIATGEGARMLKCLLQPGDRVLAQREDHSEEITASSSYGEDPAAEMAQWSGAVATLKEDLKSVPSTHIVAPDGIWL